MNKIGELYDTLKNINDSKSCLYSIHKNLNYANSEITNLYDFLVDSFDFKQKKSILDCGCGVGFGTLLMAKKLNAKFTGISVSTTEIESARENLEQEKSLQNVNFECKSFDDLSAEKYDAIIAIESLKHSPELSKSLFSVLNSLKKGGEIYIIEDVLVKDTNSSAAQNLMKDWVLARLYSEKDYTEFSDEMEWSSIDLTPMMNKYSKLIVAAKIIGAEIKTGIDYLFNKKDSAAYIFRGGFYQEWLYLNGDLGYKLLIGKKT